MLQGARKLVLIVAVALLGLAAVPARSASADVVQQHNDDGSTGWYPDQSTLSSVVVPNGTFGQLFKGTVDGQVYAQPLVSNGQVLVNTENAKAYAFPKNQTGDNIPPTWSVNLGNPWHAADLGCADLTPNIGVTSTAVVDPTTNTEYLTAKTYASGNSGPAVYKMHALDVTTGAERAGFPVTVQGTAQNAPNVGFNATMELQRPGLLLMNGVVYAAFGGHCDRAPYIGWVIGISTTGETRTRYVDQASGATGAGIWQAGGKLLSDQPGDIVLATGNGHLTLSGPTDGSTPPGDLGEAVVRLRLQPDNSLKAVDFFTPYDAPTLDERDADFGSGGPVALPESYNGTPLFGTAQHPHLMLQEGKAGYVYLLDRNDLGGYRMGASAGDASLARLGPLGGVWSTAAVWPGDGGYVYIMHGAAGPAPHTGYFRAYKYGVDGQGNPTFTPVAKAVDGFGFGSGTPVVTSDGLTSGSALVWTVWQADGSGSSAQLRAYDAVPVNGQMHLRWSAPIGTATKFAPPAVSDNRVYVGTRDGHIIGFGSPVNQPFTASPASLNFGSVKLGTTKSLSLTLTARRAIDVGVPSVSASTSGASYTKGPTTPDTTAGTHLAAGAVLTIPVSYTPTLKGISSGTITVPVTGEASYLISAQGFGQVAGGDLTSFPDQVSLGGAPIGGASVTQTITFTNIGASALHVTGRDVPAPATYMTVTGLPANGATVAAGQSVIATVTFAPKKAGLFAGGLTLHTDAAPPGTPNVTVPITGSAAPPAHLTLTATASYFGAVRLGTTATRFVTLRNTGGTPLTITKSKPPALGRGFFVAPNGGLDEGSTLNPGKTAVIGVSFAPLNTRATSDTWVINADDDSGLHTLTFSGLGAVHKVGYWMADRAGRVYTIGNPGTTALAVPPPTGRPLVSITPTPSKLGYWTLDTHGKVQRSGDAQTFGDAQGKLGAFEIATSMSSTASGRGYWIFTSLGRAFAFGDAPRLGDLSGKRLSQPIIASVATPSGLGYYMIGGDGGVFTFGDARFFGSTGAMRLNKPVVALVPTPSGRGYWLAASDGGIFTFGDAKFFGSMGATRLRKPVIGMVGQGTGYLMVASDGGIFNFSNQVFAGSLGGQRLPAPISAVAPFTV